MNKRAVLIGAGGAGRRYLDVLIRRGYRVAVVDPSASSRDMADQAAFALDASIDHVSSGEVPAASPSDVAVIACPADQHLRWLQDLVALGYPRVLVEKVMVNSLEDVRSLAATVNGNPSLSVVTHNRWGLLRTMPAVEALQASYGLGSLVSFRSIGGRFDLASGGVHFLALLAEYLDATSDAIAHLETNLDLDFPNPRGTHLRQAFGSITVTSQSGVRWHLDYSPRGASIPLQTWTFEHGFLVQPFVGDARLLMGAASTPNRYHQVDWWPEPVAVGGDVDLFELAIDQFEDDHFGRAQFHYGLCANALLLAALCRPVSRFDMSTHSYFEDFDSRHLGIAPTLQARKLPVT